MVNSEVSNLWLVGCENIHMLILCNCETMLSFAKSMLETCITKLQKDCQKKSHQLSMTA